ncbi:AI-2E family transporter [Pseudobacillus badius]|uniref:AI-2E family transporter n=1 Tax=Bacillus badius TaxID=1455 RepID=UPI0024A4E702|nr:AI-2E family transporter [Bacillus badius]GLY10206.1 AI-2E family transporter [Bacillus badius]
MDEIKGFFQRTGVKRFLIAALIILILYLMRSMINLILFTFIFAFLMDRLVEFTAKHIPLNRKLLVLCMYSLIVTLLTFGLVKYLPIITVEIGQLIKRITAFYAQPHDNVFMNYIEEVISSDQITAYLENGVSFLIKSFSDISKTSINILISLILSLFFLLEKPRLQEFTQKFKHSKVAPFYYEIEYFGRKFTRTFGKVIEAQFIIAFINCILSVIALMILGFQQIFGLAIMIFFLGLIPVAGVILSLVPLCLIAYTIGGFIKVIYVIIAIAIIHAIEAYILNPKLMSSKTDLPVFYTFVVLIFSEHFFGVWGLIIGIPVFVFLLDVLEVTNKDTAPLPPY